MCKIGRLPGYCPFLACTGSRYNNLYRDTGLGRLAWARVRGAHGRPRYGRLGHDTGHDTTKGGHDTADILAGGLCRDTKFCIVTRARDWPLGVVSRYSLCIVTGERSG